jgi:hypothetical protein
LEQKGVVIPNPRQRVRAFISARVGVRDLALSKKVQTVPLPFFLFAELYPGKVDGSFKAEA